MSFFSRSSKGRHREDVNRGSKYYKRQGFFSRLFRMLGSFSNSRSKYNSGHYYNSRKNYYSNKRYHRKNYKSSWS
ncbi:hypothetical protein GTH52_00170 [Clostridium tyrobutyricum]|jgi:hypothetical protein|uniref:hypothetical protein n=1 Tax=Clostridium tyrobutyricum TaxID=1519 RepID=UPI00035FF954|nr:hypothetical protein [Clostridium tyrobutyricum]ANP70259.1 hypothetical protein BA182_11385 [Clostridium tyrobutyricum]MBV4424465.1 hypothetical protein [Clostridium tyrobutyricum]MBV4434688.1 hypothetical protein [Clostridium tyrobutyricum]MEA5007453.1 hypothetical protein [Clostridium tyrobutyricum]QNB65380.1 hypothetical protein GTH52_00170 [Clostridium tyrobutyricum]